MSSHNWEASAEDVSATSFLAGDNKPAGSETIIYTCGPEAMMSRVAAISVEYGISCQVSLERIMACGTGLCQGCAVKCIDKKTKETGYKLCFKNGPVFWADEFVW